MAHSSDIVRRLSNADGGVILHLQRGTLFRVNPMASKILDLLDQGLSVPQIALALSTECGVPLNVVETDLLPFYRYLQEHGIVDPSAKEC